MIASDSICPVCSARSALVYLENVDETLRPSAIGSSRTEVSPGRILRCRVCRLGYRQLRPSQEELAELYRDLDGRIYEAESTGRFRTAARHMKLVQRYSNRPGRLLDIGCASGLFLRCALDANWEVVGIEPSEVLSRKAQEFLGSRAQVHCATLESLTLMPASFDVITLWDVLEHVPDPVSLLRQSASLLRAGGCLFMNVPNLDSFQARLFRTRWPLLLPEHLNYFNSSSLRLCGDKAGLQCVRSFQRPADFSLTYILHRLRQHSIPGALIAQRLLSRIGLGDVHIPVYLGEICVVWTSQNP